MTNSLILDSLKITNFRAFRQLEIKRLGRINLIVGRNNVGKTCLLEALWLYANRGATQTIEAILEERNEFAVKDKDEKPILTAKHLFYGYEDAANLEEKFLGVGSGGPLYNNGLFMRILAVDENILKAIISEEGVASQDIHALVASLIRKKIDISQLISQLTEKLPKVLSGNMKPALFVAMARQRKIVNTDFKQIYISSKSQAIPAQFIFTNGLDQADMADLWDKVYLTDLEDDVVEALRILEPNIKSVGLVQHAQSSNQRIPQARMSDARGRVLLSSLGEGMNRIFGLTLALVNAKNGVLLVDEVGNGIHYSVQPQLWDFIFQVAERLKVQVFATTHSWDALEAFQQAVKRYQDVDGLLISLRNKKDSPGEVIGTLFEAQDLDIITRDQIEVR